jgi:hypothetical protein
MKDSVYSNNPHTTDDSIITEYIRNVDRAILNTVLENTVQRVNKYLETGEGHFEYFFLLGAAAQRGSWPPHSRGFLFTHNGAPQSVGLLWTSDQLIAETST